VSGRTREEESPRPAVRVNQRLISPWQTQLPIAPAGGRHAFMRL